MRKKSYLFTSESVSEGHPDKVCDRISDMVVDTYISKEPFSRVACETLTTTNKVVLAGETRGPKIEKDDLKHKNIVIDKSSLEMLKGSKVDFTKEWYEAFTNVADTKKEYLRAMLINGEDLSKEPRIKVSTIHVAKGGEATNVVLFLNQTLNTMKAAKKSKAKQDEEYRVWYVGVTRTIKNLYLIKCNNKQKEFSI